MSERTQVWSCGGGVQSAAIAALIVQGRIPKPDISLMVDTERERTSTWEYFDSVLKPALKTVNVEVVIIPKSQFATVDIYKGKKRSVLLPMFTDQSGNLSKLPTFCSNEWKQRVARRYLRSVGVEQCEQWLGMSMDEPQRVKDSDVDWILNRYPLIYDVPMWRRDCIAMVESMGWPSPPRSSCWMCPNMGSHEWKNLHDNYPADFGKAILLEREVREVDEHVFLHKSGMTLDKVDFHSQSSLFDEDDGGCESGMCFV